MNKDERPLVSVIIPTFNRINDLKKCLNSVFSSTYKNIEVIIVDDCSTDNSMKTILKNYDNKKIKYIYSKDKHFLSYNLNIGIKKSKGSLILKLDDDNQLHKKAIEYMVYEFLNNNNFGVVGPIALYAKNPDIVCHAGVRRSKFMRRALYPFMNCKLTKTIDSNLKIDDFTNVFMFNRDAAIKSGLMDLDIPYMGEDSEFQARISKLGYGIKLCSAAIVYHNIPFNNEIYFLRFNEIRFYHTMRSKVIYEIRYAPNIKKITFLTSIPLYWGYYAYRIFKNSNNFNKNTIMFYNVIKGTFSGLKLGFSGKSNIEWL